MTGSSIKLAAAQDVKSDTLPLRGLIVAAFLPLADLGEVVGDNNGVVDDVTTPLCSEIKDGA